MRSMQGVDIHRLFASALEALRAEDQDLRRCFRESHTNVAPGLTYWLFETTLVYFIFKAWLKDVDVAWEHGYGAVQLREKAVGARSGGRRQCDLVILEKGEPTLAFEAKWWNDGTTKTFGSLLEDANRLRSGFGRDVGKYLLTFWYGESQDATSDLAEARAACRPPLGLSIVEHDTFETRLIGRAGYFALALVAVADLPEV
jgi:hypothetical protein